MTDKDSVQGIIQPLDGSILGIPPLAAMFSVVVSSTSSINSNCKGLSREEGFALLEDFICKIPDYPARRSFDEPGHPYVSGLSQFLRFRLIQEKEVLSRVLEKFDYRVAQGFIEQVLWRTYFKGYLEQHPSIWIHYLREVDRLASEGRTRSADYQKATHADTGIACFDHWVNQLLDTGYLHNHARMWFASIWIFTLELPWELGAAFFLQHLLDGDPASNTLSWRWVAGLHTPGKNYLARAENIQKYTRDRFYPEGLNETAGPVSLNTARSGCVQLDPLASSVDSLFPCLSTSPSGLLVTPEDCSPEASELGESPFGSICVLSSRQVTRDIQFSDKVASAIDCCITDTGLRLASDWGGVVLPIDGAIDFQLNRAHSSHVGNQSQMRVYAGNVENWVASVVNWAQREHLKSVRMFRPPIGPYRQMLDTLRASLAASGIPLFEYRRQWDNMHWPHAKGGYFPFKEGLQARLEALLKQ